MAGVKVYKVRLSVKHHSTASRRAQHHMKFKPSIWYPIAIILAGINLIAVPIFSGDPLHAMGHGAAAVFFGLWAQRLKQRRDQGQDQTAVGAPGEERIELMEDELSRLRQELTEAQERLDFTERMLAQRSQQEPRRVEREG